MLPRLAEVREFFSWGMSRGWVSGAPEISIRGLPGFKCIAVEREEWHLLDAYCVTNGWSSGFTTISINGQVLFKMDYGGSYPKVRLPFLKQVLLETYISGEWCAGRGPVEVIEGNLAYRNQVLRNSVRTFSGLEVIESVRTGFRLGWHLYDGISLVDP